MKWSILILTQMSRENYLNNLLRVLHPQVEEFSDKVELVVRQCDHRIFVGDNRQIMREQARGDYSNFVDDDDLVSVTYVRDLLPLMDGVDFIGHRISRYDDGIFTGEYEHSLRHRGSSSPHSTPHINPIRTKLALKASMSGGYGEDRRWWYELMDNNLIKTENYIDEVEYSYYYRSNKADGVARSE